MKTVASRFLLFIIGLSLLVGINSRAENMILSPEESEIKSQLMQKFRALNPEDLNSEYRFFEYHMQDSLKSMPSLAQLKSARLPRPQTISGIFTYAGGLSKKEYHYDVKVESGVVIHEVRVFFKNAKPDENAKFAKLLALAAERWTSSIDQDLVSFPVKFRFLVAETIEESHYAVSLSSASSILKIYIYDQTWSRKWTENQVSHEVGHMMGLNDEYDYVSLTVEHGLRNCDVASIMCDSHNKRGTALPRVNHSYFILRRLVQP